MAATPHRQLLIFNTFASGGSLARRVARDVASWWQVAARCRSSLAWCSCKWFTFHLPSFSAWWVFYVSVCCVCVCALCVACMRVVAAGNCMLLVLAAYTIPSTDTETIFYFYSFHTKFARSDGLFTNNQRGHTTHPPLTTHQQGMLPHLAPAPHTQSCSPPSLQSNRCLIRC